MGIRFSADPVVKSPEASECLMEEAEPTSETTEQPKEQPTEQPKEVEEKIEAEALETEPILIEPESRYQDEEEDDSSITTPSSPSSSCESEDDSVSDIIRVFWYLHSHKHVYQHVIPQLSPFLQWLMQKGILPYSTAFFWSRSFFEVDPLALTQGNARFPSHWDETFLYEPEYEDKLEFERSVQRIPELRVIFIKQ